MCHLKRTLYGLKQAPRAWYTRLKKELVLLGFEESDADPGLYVLRHDNGIIYLLVYVDDLLFAGATKDVKLQEVKTKLQAIFDSRDLGDVNLFVGIELIRNRTAGTLKICQPRMIGELLTKYGMLQVKTRTTPLSASIKLVKDSGELLDTNKFPYSELIGSLLYLAVCTRPDIAQAVGALARHMSAPSEQH